MSKNNIDWSAWILEKNRQSKIESLEKGRQEWKIHFDKPDATREAHDKQWIAAHPHWENHASTEKLNKLYNNSLRNFKRTGKIITHKESDLSTDSQLPGVAVSVVVRQPAYMPAMGQQAG